MISFRLTSGSGDREAAVVSDSLISSEAIAKIRAGQILASNLWIIKERTLSTPHDPDMKVGTKKEFYSSKFGISGLHLITSRSISLLPDLATDSVTIEKYGVILP